MSNPKHCTIAIIGAGMAGISAARAITAYNVLHPENPLSYVVLEADSKMGGRVQSQALPHTDAKGKPVIINPGAQWIHRDVRDGTPENPLLEIAESLGLRTLRDTMPRMFCENGVCKRFVPGMEATSAARKIIDGYKDADIDVETLLNKRGNLGNALAVRTAFGEVETGAPLNEVSAHDVRELVACNRGDFVFDGVGALFERFAASIKDNVQLNSVVTKIRIGKNDSGVFIELKNGENVRAKQCILTASVGVLKSGAIAIEPGLPPEQQAQLDALHMGQFNKIFMVVRPEFVFPVNVNTHMDVHHQGRDLFFLARDNGQPLITAFLGGKMAEMCDKTPDKAKQICIDALAKIWGNDVKDAIKFTQVTQWGNNPLVLGGYSRVAVGHHDARQKLAEPIHGALHLAGEAMGTIHPQTGRNWATHMTGAALSGERAALQAMKVLELDAPHQWQGMISGAQQTRRAEMGR